MFEIQSWKVQTLKLELQQFNVQRLHFNVEKFFAGKLARNFFAGIASLYTFAGILSRYTHWKLYENGDLKMKPSSAS